MSGRGTICRAVIIPIHLKLLTTFECLILKVIVELLLFLLIVLVLMFFCTIMGLTSILFRNILAETMLLRRVKAIVPSVHTWARLQTRILRLYIKRIAILSLLLLHLPS